MREVGAFEAKNTLGTLLDAVARGEEITITRRGKPVARLVPPGTTVDRKAAKAAAMAEARRALARDLVRRIEIERLLVGLRCFFLVAVLPNTI